MVGFVGQADPRQQAARLFQRLGTRGAEHLDRRLDDIFQRSHMGEQVEALEHHADVPALTGDVALRIAYQAAVAAFAIAHGAAVDTNASALDIFEQVDAADKGGLARAGGADQHHHFAPPHLQRDALENLQLAERLLNIQSLNDQLFTLVRHG